MHITRKALIFIFAGLVFPGIAFCEDGNELLANLQSPSSADNLRAYSYIHGILDYEELIKYKEIGEFVFWGNAASKKKKFSMPLICIPEGVKGKQIFDMVRQYLEANPSTRHENALRFVRAPLLEAWPCKGNVEQESNK